MAHAIHPNYLAKDKFNHDPGMNKGHVPKINADQCHITNSPDIVLLQGISNLANLPLPLFVARNDSSCDSTIGPMLSAP